MWQISYCLWHNITWSYRFSTCSPIKCGNNEKDDMQRWLNSLYLHLLPAVSSFFAVSPVFHALPSPLLHVLSSVSPLILFALSSPSVLAVGEKERAILSGRQKGKLSRVNCRSANTVKYTRSYKAQNMSSSRH